MSGSDNDDDAGSPMLHAMGRQRSNSAPPGFDIPLPLDAAPPAESDPARPATALGAPTTARRKTRGGAGGGRSITVLARFRPENAQELANGGHTVARCHADNETVDLAVDVRYVTSNGDDKETYQFRFDKIFPSYATQMDTWGFVGDTVLDNLMQGVNASILAYGQTGSGKTYTMMGGVDPKTQVVTDNPGIIPRVFTGLFQRIEEIENTHSVRIEMNFVELYMERLYDLLSENAINRTQLGRNQWHFVGDFERDAKPEIRDGGNGTVYIANCRTALIGDAQTAMEVVQHGLKFRATASTGSNLQSSRSHAIVLVTVITKDLESMVETKAQLYLVDLAGSEKVAKTEAQGLRLDEATSINLSLHALGNVITALSLRQTSRKHANMHVPFRNSKLTRLLENSLGGNAVTFVCLTVSPSSFNDQETLSTLRFGAKAKLVTTKPKRNQQRTAEELELLLEKAKAEAADLKMQVSLLRRQLANAASGGGGGNDGVGSPNDPAPLKIGKNGPQSTALSKGEERGRAMWSRIVRRNEAELSRLISAALTCPLTGRQFRTPVVALDGQTYERNAIDSHLRGNDMRSPVTGEQVQMSLLVPNQLVRSLIAMTSEGGFLASDFGAPMTIFDVPDVLGDILDWLPQQTVLSYARVCANFARAAYSKYRWKPLIHQLVGGLPAAEAEKVLASTLPAHKVYLMLVRNPEAAAQRVQQLQYLSGQTVALYSSGLRPAKR